MDYKEVPQDCVKTITQQNEINCKLYKRRWLVLALFVLYSTSNAMQWIQYSIIDNIVRDYYKVSPDWVDWTSMVYMVSYAILIVPGSWALDKFGLRVCVLAGSVGTCAGAWAKVFSTDEHHFYIGFIGQSIVAVSQVFILSIPARLAAVWFGPKEVSSACSIGVFGNQLGVALGFVLPPMLVHINADPAVTKSEFDIMFRSIAGFTSVLLLLNIFLFKDCPPLPPSPAQAVLHDKEGKDNAPDFKQSILSLATNKGYVLLLISYGLNVGVFYAISTLLNRVVLKYFPGANADAGRIGLTMVVAGMVGSVICGITLDRTHKFKETTLFVYVFSLVGMIVFTFTLGSGHIEIVYTTIGLLGFFMTGYLPVGFELAAELTYPEPEGTSAGLLNGFCQIFGISLTMLYSHLLDAIAETYSNLVLCGILVIGSLLTLLIPSDLRRQRACQDKADHAAKSELA